MRLPRRAFGAAWSFCLPVWAIPIWKYDVAALPFSPWGEGDPKGRIRGGQNLAFLRHYVAVATKILLDESLRRSALLAVSFQWAEPKNGSSGTYVRSVTECPTRSAAKLIGTVCANTRAPSGVSRLIDADMGEASARMKALRTQQKLAVQSLQIANTQAQNILSRFQ
ncbi:flagellin [Shinella zoogloeoides]|uniref:flagellin n=1 Tax=Shinella zoogloeoides TaxID=352475 RepID=UPI0039181A96